MKKIAIVCLNLSVCGGIERVSVNLANALSNRYSVFLISICACERFAFAPDRNVRFFSFNEKLDKVPLLKKRVATQLKNYMEANDISIAVLQGQIIGYLFARYKPESTKLIFCDHGSLRGDCNNVKAIYMDLLSSFFSQVTVCLTKRNYKDYSKLLWRKKVLQIPNWIEPDHFISEEYQMESKRIISAGRLSYEKGFGILVEAFARIPDDYGEWTLDIFGEGPEKQYLMQLINDYHLEGRIKLLGEVDNLPELYQEYSFYVMPSLHEGLPMVLLEAKANRLPVISFNVPIGPQEIIHDQEDGILVWPRTPQKLADAIAYLISNTETRIRMSKDSNNGMERFLKNNVLEKWFKLIDEL